MNKKSAISIALLAAWLVMIPTAGALGESPPPGLSAVPALASSLPDGMTVQVRNEDFSMLGEVHIKEGEVHPQDLVVIGGTARVEGEVLGDIVVILGELYLSGHANRGVVAVLSEVTLDDGAVIEREFVNVLGHLDKATDVEIGREFINISFLDLSGLNIKGFPGGLLHIMHVITAAKLAVLFLIVILITALAPHRVTYAGNAFATDWPKALLYGLATFIISIVAGFILCITLIGIPVVVAMYFGWLVAKWMGLTAIFFLVGDRIGKNLFSKELSLFPSILIGFILFGALRFVPLFIGGMLWFGLSILAVGLSISTRFGSGEPWFKGRNRQQLPPASPAAGPPAGDTPPPAPDTPAENPGAAKPTLPA